MMYDVEMTHVEAPSDGCLFRSLFSPNIDGFIFKGLFGDFDDLDVLMKCPNISVCSKRKLNLFDLSCN